MTLPLMGQTIYIESLYYPGWWIGASDRYNGELFQLSEVQTSPRIFWDHKTTLDTELGFQI